MDNDYAIRAAAYEAVATGDAEIIGERDGEPIFRLTDVGRERAAKIIDTAIRTYGHEAPEKLAESLGISVEAGEELVASRQHQ